MSTGVQIPLSTYVHYVNFQMSTGVQIPPENERITVLIHGAACLDNIMFSYDELSGRPNQALYIIYYILYIQLYII